MSTPATTICTTMEDIKPALDNCNATQIDYYTCMMHGYIEDMLKRNPIYISSERGTFRPFVNKCSHMREYGTEIEFSTLVAYSPVKYFKEYGCVPTSLPMTPAVICEAWTSSYLDSHINYKQFVVMSVFEGITRKFITPAVKPVLYTQKITQQSITYTTYRLVVPFPDTLLEEKSDRNGRDES